MWRSDHLVAIDQQVVTIGAGGNDRIGCNGAAAAGAIHHHHRLAEVRGNSREDEPHRQFHGAAGAIGDLQADGFVWPGLRHGGGRGAQCRDERQGQYCEAVPEHGL